MNEIPCDEVRCSNLDVLDNCPGSKRMPEIPVDFSSPAARVGTAVHAVMENIVKNDLNRVPDLEPYHERFPDVDKDELRILSWNGLNLWLKFRDSLDVTCIEQGFEVLLVAERQTAIKLTGHPDLMGNSTGDGDEPRIVIIDWKTERDERNHRHQLYGYAKLAAINLCSGGNTFYGALGITCWLRSGVDEVIEITREGLDKWEEEFLDKMETKKFHAGDHCYFCPHQLEPCKMQTAMMHQTLTELGGEKFAELLKGLSPAQAYAKAYPLYQRANGFCNKFRELVRPAIVEGGPQPLGDGREVYINEYNTTQVQPSKALPVLAKHFQANLPAKEGGKFLEDEDAVILLLEEAGVLKISKTKMEELIMEYAPDRKGAAHKREVMASLDEVGATSKTPMQKIGVRKIAKAVTDGK